MTDGVEVDLIGLNDLISKMQTVSKITRNKAGRSALRKAANVLRDRVRSNAQRIDNPLTQEAIFKNITASWSNRTFRRTGNLAFRVGVMGGARQYANTKANIRKGKAGKTYKTLGDKDNPGGDTWYWRFPEFGTEKMKATPFMRPIINDPDSAVIDTFASEFEKAIDRAIARSLKNGGGS